MDESRSKLKQALRIDFYDAVEEKKRQKIDQDNMPIGANPFVSKKVRE